MKGTAHFNSSLISCAVVFFVTSCTAMSPKGMSPVKPIYDAMMENVVLGGRAGEPFAPDFARTTINSLVERRSGLLVSRRLTLVPHPDLAAGRTLLKPRYAVAGENGLPGRQAEKLFLGKTGKITRMVAVANAVRRVDIHAVRRPAREFFASLVSADPNVNMIVHPDVVGDISLELKGVSVAEVVEIACEMYQFDCRPFAGRTADAVRGYKIFPWKLTTRTYRVDFLPVVREGRSETVVSSGDRKESIATSYGKDQNSSITISTNSGSSVSTEYKSDFWDDLEKTVRSILKMDLAVSSVKEHMNFQGDVERHTERKRYEINATGVQRGVEHTQSGESGKEKILLKEFTVEEKKKRVTPTEVGTGQLAADIKSIMVNRQAGLITVRAFPKEHQEIITFLEQLRSRSQRQVILEAKILEVELNDGFQFGVDWLAINKGLGSSRFPPLGSEPYQGTTFQGNQFYQRGAGDPVTNFAQPFTQAVILSQNNIANYPISLAFREHDFIGFINLLQQQGQVQVLSSPRIATINNQKAVIKVGSDEFFITGLDSGSVVGSGDAAQVRDPTAIFTSMFSGVSLDVTPQIGEGDMVTLHVHPMVTEVVDKYKSFTINEKDQRLPLAWSRTRETDSIIRVRNGEVAVIGGLMKNMSGAHERRLPLLGRIPVLGALFGETDRQWEKSELVILLRPVLVNDRQNWESRVVRSADRVRRMQSKPSLW